MAEEVGALRVSLSADTAQFERDMGRAQATAGRLGASLTSRIAGALAGLQWAVLTAYIVAFMWAGSGAVSFLMTMAEARGGPP